MTTRPRCSFGAETAPCFAQVLAAELGKDGITVNCIAPGYISTELTAALQKNAIFDGAVRDRNPQGRWGEPLDLVGPCVLLASNACKYINGAVLVVDGGFTETFHIGGVEWDQRAVPSVKPKQ